MELKRQLEISNTELSIFHKVLESLSIEAKMEFESIKAKLNPLTL
jgi:hypothetical protein